MEEQRTEEEDGVSEAPETGADQVGSPEEDPREQTGGVVDRDADERPPDNAGDAGEGGD